MSKIYALGTGVSIHYSVMVARLREKIKVHCPCRIFHANHFNYRHWVTRHKLNHKMGFSTVNKILFFYIQRFRIENNDTFIMDDANICNIAPAVSTIRKHAEEVEHCAIALFALLQA